MGKNQPTPRVQEHLERLRAAGLKTEDFFEALIALRDDSGLPQAHREALYRTIGMESFIWYLEALRGEPVDRIKAAHEAKQIAEENSVAIKRRKDGDSATELVKRDISLKPGTPGPGKAPTQKKAPPRKKGPAPRKAAAPRSGPTRGPQPRRPAPRKAAPKKPRG